MTPHLLPEELVDAAEGTIDAGRAAHVAECAGCAAELARLRTLLRGVEAAGDVPDPSPLFWDHLSARVRAEVASAPPASAWWRMSWRPLAALSAVAAVILAVVLTPPPSPTTETDTAVVADAGPAEIWLPVLEDGSFDLVLDLASDLEWDEVRQAAAPRAGTADAMIQELSPAEREQLVTLLKTEIGEME